MMDNYRHVSPRQKGAEEEGDILQPADECAVKRPGEVIVQGLEILHEQKGQQNSAGRALYQQSNPTLFQLATDHVWPFRQPHSGKHSPPIQESGEIPRSQNGFQGTAFQSLAHLSEDLLRGDTIHVTQDDGRMALGPHFHGLELQRGILHASADHGHVQLIAFGEAILGSPLHHLVLGLLGTPVGKSLDTGKESVVATIHAQQHKAAHQQGEQLGHPVLMLYFRRAQHLALDAVQHLFGIVRVLPRIQERLHDTEGDGLLVHQAIDGEQRRFSTGKLHLPNDQIHGVLKTTLKKRLILFQALGQDLLCHGPHLLTLSFVIACPQFPVL